MMFVDTFGYFAIKLDTCTCITLVILILVFDTDLDLLSHKDVKLRVSNIIVD